jgi:arylsulfatase A-like enzyme
MRSESYVYLLDLLPTIFEFTGTPVPSTSEGRSLVPAIQNPSEKIRHSLYFAYTSTQRAVKNRQYKLIEYVVEGERQTQLFDLAADPWETRNLAEEADCAGILRECRCRLQRWRDEWDDCQHPLGQEFWVNRGLD